jgi:hypothetical protein
LVKQSLRAFTRPVSQIRVVICAGKRRTSGQRATCACSERLAT